MRATSVELPQRQVALHIGSSFSEAWTEVIRPWFESVARVSQSTGRYVAIVTPFRSNAYAIKQLALNCGMSLLGVRFISPAELREMLAAGGESCAPSREHLRLLLSIAAEECIKLPEDPVMREKRMLEPDFLAAKAVMRAPNYLLRTIDRLGAAGWDLTAVELPASQEIVAAFRRLLAGCGFELLHTADRRALGKASTSPAFFENLLVVGFTGAHWPLWPLLRAAVHSAHHATVLLEDPADETRDIDEPWVGTWEQIFGEAQPVSSRVSRMTDSLFTDEEMRGSSPRSADRSFLIGADTTEQAEAVARQCLTFLGDSACDRIGIVFSGAGALPRLVASALARLDIPHHDGVSHFVPGIFERTDWRAWLELQQNPRINSLLRFVNAFPDPDEICCGVSAATFERTLRAAYAEVLIDDLDILKRFCAQTVQGQAVTKTIDSIALLPARARLADFLRVTKAALDQLGWDAHWMQISRHLGAWTQKLEVEFSQGLYLRWLTDIAYTFAASREPLGDHPYARVQLLTVPQAEGQDWSHLIFAGWNEGSWPPPETAEFVAEDQIDAFNRRIQKLNRRATRQGKQGEGHTVIDESHTLYLGPREQRQVARRQFERLVGSATEKITFTASLVQEETPERLWNPSELFTRHYLAARNSPLTQRTMSQLQVETRRWLQAAPNAKPQGSSSLGEANATRIAYDARRDPNLPSGEYDFAFRSKAPVAPTLSVSDFEQLLSAPALVWLKKYVGVKAPEESGNIWNSSTGKWVHDWLAAIAMGTARTFSRLPSAAEIEQRVGAAAERKRAEVGRLCETAGKPFPDWWTGGWRNAVFLARVLAEKVAAIGEWPWMATEWTVQDDQPVQVGETAWLSLRGRIDLLLARTEPAAGSLATEGLWIIDYKTGAKKALGRSAENGEGRRPGLKKKLLDGSALQLGLYSLAATTLGARDVEVSLVSPVVRVLQPQMSATEFASETDILAELARMQQTGIFGMHGPLRNAFRFTDDYPLATLAIDPDVLEQRWELTHPALVRDEEEIFW